jgi:hypothetical protein
MITGALPEINTVLKWVYLMLLVAWAREGARYEAIEYMSHAPRKVFTAVGTYVKIE